jgi:hypothetical protein
LRCEEKRKMDRFTLALPAEISITDESGKQRSFSVVTKNICAGGAFFKTDESLSDRTSVKIDLILSLDNLPGMEGRGSRIDVSGKVVRTESHGMAVCFDKLYQISPMF